MIPIEPIHKTARLFIIGLAVAAVIFAVFGLAQCGKNDRAVQRQAEQTAASAEAISDAAAVAINTIGNRAVTEKDINHATTIAVLEIGDAVDPDDVRAAVIRGVCRTAQHSTDPACTLR